jgi:TatD DNase family protein
MAELVEAIASRLPPAPAPLPIPTTDAHTHLVSTAEFSGLSMPDALAAARAVNVTRVVEVGTDVASSRDAIALADAHPEVVAALAIHPNDAARLGDALPSALDELAALFGTSPGIRGVGETGLDYFRTREADGQARQRDAFAAHIACAKQHDLALVIHCRDAGTDLLDVLDAEGVPARVQMHCFSGGPDFARACLDRGCWLSFAGPVTFKANADLRDALRLTPADRLLVETDAPYLTPLPHRGKPNSSYLLPHTVRFVADLLGRDLAELCGQLDANASALFGDWGRNG